MLINFVNDDKKSYSTRMKIMGIIYGYKKIVRPENPISSKLLKLCRKSGFKIVRYKKFNYYLSVDDFYKNRFKLTGSQTKSIIHILRFNHHRSAQIGILMQKPL